MALLNISICSKFPAKPLCSCPRPSIFAHPSPLALPLKQRTEASNKLTLPLAKSVSAASLAALLSVSLFVVDPALAFKGGGPYGQEVTRGQDLTGRDFSGKTLIKQDFKTSILRQANFRGSKLLGASFFDADLTATDHALGRLHFEFEVLTVLRNYLRYMKHPFNNEGADLSDADLRGADFSLANVTKANLSNANLEGALATGNTSFKGTNITGADFTDVPLRDDQREYLCKVADGVNPTTGNVTRETLLCN